MPTDKSHRFLAQIELTKAHGEVYAKLSLYKTRTRAADGLQRYGAKLSLRNKNNSYYHSKTFGPMLSLFDLIEKALAYAEDKQ
jgi:hypothetical protein